MLVHQILVLLCWIHTKNIIRVDIAAVDGVVVLLLLHVQKRLLHLQILHQTTAILSRCVVSQTIYWRHLHASIVRQI